MKDNNTNVHEETCEIRNNLWKSHTYHMENERFGGVGNLIGPGVFFVVFGAVLFLSSHKIFGVGFAAFGLYLLWGIVSCSIRNRESIETLEEIDFSLRMRRHDLKHPKGLSKDFLKLLKQSKRPTDKEFQEAFTKPVEKK